MGWTRISHGYRLDPLAGGPAEAVAIVLHDFAQPTAALLAIAARWAAVLPTTGFVAFDGVEQLDPPPCGDSWRPMLDLETGAEPLVLDRFARHVEPLLAPLDPRRLVLVGFRQGGTAALHVVLRCGWPCVGVLAFSPSLTLPLPRMIRIDAKVRLIESADNARAGHTDVRTAVAALAARGVDARGVILDAASLSDTAIRHGGAYLKELVATAQHADPFSRAEQEVSNAS